MTPDLPAIEARLAKATPGPWKVNYKDGVIQVGPEGAEDLAWITNLSDATLVAHAPTDLRALVEEVKRLRMALSQIRDMEMIVIDPAAVEQSMTPDTKSYCAALGACVRLAQDALRPTERAG